MRYSGRKTYYPPFILHQGIACLSFSDVFRPALRNVYFLTVLPRAQISAPKYHNTHHNKQERENKENVGDWGMVITMVDLDARILHIPTTL